MTARFERFVEVFSNWLAWIGLASLVIMMAITCIDVIGAKLFLRPVFGAIDIVMLAQLVAIAFGGSATLILGRHVQVEIFMFLVPERVRAVVDIFVYLLCFALFALIVWRLIIYGHIMQSGGETSSTARIPLYPLAYSISFACIPISLKLFLEIINSILKVAKK
jgi:TRAP-type C4-dicarboxylate transport system permease small subunit